MNTRQDDLLRLYEEACAMEEGKPAPQVRSAVLAHAAMLAQGGTKPAAPVTMANTHASNWPHWKSGLVASILLVPLLGMLMFQLKEAPELQEQAAVTPHVEVPVAAKRAAPAMPPQPLVTATAADQPSTQGNLGAIASAEKRADRSETMLARPRESASVVSNLAAAPPAAPGLAAPAKSLGAAIGVSRQGAELLQAARQGNVQLVQTLVTQGASPNIRDTQGRTALMLAVLGGHASLVKRLKELGADTDAVDQDGLTALQHAQRLGNEDISSLLQ